MSFGTASAKRIELALVNGQVSVSELEDCGIDGGRINGADVPFFPGSRGRLLLENFLADHVEVLFPFLAIFATVHHLSIVQVGVVPMAEEARSRLSGPDIFFAEL